MNTACMTIIKESHRLAALSDELLGQQFLAFTEMVECTFLSEESRMENADFPFLKSHREQHAMVLRSLYRVASQVLAGDTSTAREILAGLPSWMFFHSATSDRFAERYIAQADGNSTAAAGFAEKAQREKAQRFAPTPSHA